MDISGIGGADWSRPTANAHRTRQNLPDEQQKLQENPASSAAPKASGAEIVKQFMDYMEKTPEQRMLDAWLGQHGISREEFDSMSPEEKQKILDEMKQDMEARLKQKMDRPSKTSADILA